MKTTTFVALLALLISGCTPSSAAPSDQDIQTAIAKTNVAQMVNPSDVSTSTIQPTAIPTIRVQSTNTPRPTPKPTLTKVPTATPDPNLLKPGTYLVGTEIDPGIYFGRGSYCYWERLKDLTGSFDAIITNNGPEGQFYVEILDSDFAFMTKCDLIPLETIPEDSIKISETIEPGEYLVGRDILPGIYQGEGSSCYWERRSSANGSFTSLIANGGPEGQFYIEVLESDFLFTTKCKVNLLRELPAPAADMPKSIDPGMYLIGIDIAPGMYKGEGDYCYWERLRKVDGSFNSIITNGGPEGQFYVDVQATDFAFMTGCPLELVE